MVSEADKHAATPITFDIFSHSHITCTFALIKRNLMTTQEFFQLADTAISNNPQDRLPTDIKNVLSAQTATAENIIFDVHSHCFTLEHVPKGFMNLGWVRNFSFGMGLVATVFSLVGKFKKLLNGKDYDYFEAFAKKRFLFE